MIFYLFLFLFVLICYFIIRKKNQNVLDNGWTIFNIKQQWFLIISARGMLFSDILFEMLYLKNIYLGIVLKNHIKIIKLESERILNLRKSSNIFNKN